MAQTMDVESRASSPPQIAPPPPSSAHVASSQWGHDRDTLARRLALAKVRELRESGMSYRTIGRLFRTPIPQTCGRGDSAAPDASALATEPQSGQINNPVFDHHIFVRALDTLSLGLAFFDCSGKLVHGNHAMLQILTHGPDGRSLQEEMRREVSLVLSKTRTAHDHAVMEINTREVREGDRRYRLRTSYVGVQLFEPGNTILISVEVVKASPISEEMLQLRHRLTSQEAKVAIMLLHGHSNRLIAQTLFISEHTARHHTQRVLEKLGIRSRSGIAARLLYGQ